MVEGYLREQRNDVRRGYIDVLKNCTPNAVRLSAHNTFPHERVKFLVGWDLFRKNKQFYTECVLRNRRRADVLVLDDWRIIEILASEQEAQCLKKVKNYFEDAFEIVAVRAEDRIDRAIPKLEIIKVPRSKGKLQRTRRQAQWCVRRKTNRTKNCICFSEWNSSLTFQHEDMKFMIGWHQLLEGVEYYTNCELVTGDLVDIFILDEFKIIDILEVGEKSCNSAVEERLRERFPKVPFEFVSVRVDQAWYQDIIN